MKNNGNDSNFQADLDPQSLLLLPDEVIIQIFSKLSVSEVAKLSLVNHRFHRISQDNNLWKNFCHRDFKLVIQKYEEIYKDLTAEQKEKLHLDYKQIYTELSKLKDKKTEEMLDQIKTFFEIIKKINLDENLQRKEFNANSHEIDRELSVVKRIKDIPDDDALKFKLYYVNIATSNFTYSINKAKSSNLSFSSQLFHYMKINFQNTYVKKNQELLEKLKVYQCIINRCTTTVDRTRPDPDETHDQPVTDDADKLLFIMARNIIPNDAPSSTLTSADFKKYVKDNKYWQRRFLSEFAAGGDSELLEYIKKRQDIFASENKTLTINYFKLYLHFYYLQTLFDFYHQQGSFKSSVPQNYVRYIHKNTEFYHHQGSFKSSTLQDYVRDTRENTDKQKIFSHLNSEKITEILSSPQNLAVMFRGAVRENMLELVTVLIYFNPEIPDLRWGALHIAASCGHVEMCRLLFSAGANCEALDDKGKTPLQCAIENGHYAIADVLPPWSAAVNRDTLDYSDVDQRFPLDNLIDYRKVLQWAVQNRHSKLIERILNYYNASKRPQSPKSSIADACCKLIDSHYKHWLSNADEEMLRACYASGYKNNEDLFFDINDSGLVFRLAENLLDSTEFSKQQAVISVFKGAIRNNNFEKVKWLHDNYYDLLIDVQRQEIIQSAAVSGSNNALRFFLENDRVSSAKIERTTLLRFAMSRRNQTIYSDYLKTIQIIVDKYDIDFNQTLLPLERKNIPSTPLMFFLSVWFKPDDFGNYRTEIPKDLHNILAYFYSHSSEQNKENAFAFMQKFILENFDEKSISLLPCLVRFLCATESDKIITDELKNQLLMTSYKVFLIYAAKELISNNVMRDDIRECIYLLHKLGIKIECPDLVFGTPKPYNKINLQQYKHLPAERFAAINMQYQIYKGLQNLFNYGSTDAQNKIPELYATTLDSQNRTPLIRAILTGDMDDAFEFLDVSKQRVLDHQDNEGNTAFHYAITAGLFEIAYNLSKAGANSNIRNNDGQLPYELAKSDEDEFLLRFGENLIKRQVTQLQKLCKAEPVCFKSLIDDMDVKPYARQLILLGTSKQIKLVIDLYRDIHKAQGYLVSHTNEDESSEHNRMFEKVNANLQHLDMLYQQKCESEQTLKGLKTSGYKLPFFSSFSGRLGKENAPQAVDSHVRKPIKSK